MSLITPYLPRSTQPKLTATLEEEPMSLITPYLPRSTQPKLTATSEE